MSKRLCKQHFFECSQRNFAHKYQSLIFITIYVWILWNIVYSLTETVFGFFQKYEAVRHGIYQIMMQWIETGISVFIPKLETTFSLPSKVGNKVNSEGLHRYARLSVVGKWKSRDILEFYIVSVWRKLRVENFRKCIERIMGAELQLAWTDHKIGRGRRGTCHARLHYQKRLNISWKINRSLQDMATPRRCQRAGRFSASSTPCSASHSPWSCSPPWWNGSWFPQREFSNFSSPNYNISIRRSTSVWCI